jgi:hypothetical protein
MKGHEREDELLEAMLRAEQPYLEDAGFTAKVMERLPPRRRTVAFLRIGILFGSSGLAALVLLLNRPLCVEISRAFSRISHPSALSLSTLSLVSVVMVVMLLWAGLTAVERE